MEFFKENFRNKIKKTRESGRESFYVGLRFFLGLNFVKAFHKIGTIFPNELIERQAVHDKFFIGQGDHASDVFGKKCTNFFTIDISNQKRMRLFDVAIRNTIDNIYTAFEVCTPDKFLVLLTKANQFSISCFQHKTYLQNSVNKIVVYWMIHPD